MIKTMRDKNGRYMKGFNNQLGRKRSDESKQKMREAKLGKFEELSNNWRGGVYPVNMLIRRSERYRQWRKDVFTRDNYTCVQCGDKKGGNLEADHIKAFSSLLREYGVTSTQSALICADLWDIANGRTLCVECHKKTDSYGAKSINKQ